MYLTVFPLSRVHQCWPWGFEPYGHIKDQCLSPLPCLEVPACPSLEGIFFFFTPNSLSVVFDLTQLDIADHIMIFILIPFRASHLRKMCLMVCLFLLHGLSVLTAESTLSWSTVLLRAPIHSWEGQNCVWASSQTLSVEAPFLSNSNRRARPALLARNIDQP